MPQPRIEIERPLSDRIPGHGRVESPAGAGPDSSEPTASGGREGCTEGTRPFASIKGCLIDDGKPGDGKGEEKRMAMDDRTLLRSTDEEWSTLAAQGADMDWVVSR
jgi:hypothetical protein